MADISKIKPNGASGEEYEIKDTTARTGVLHLNALTQSTKTVTGNPITVNDAAPINAEDITVDIEPQQDLHGYDRPWAGGAGKNKLPMTVDGIKAANTSGTWNGNAYTINNITFEILTDDADNITGFKVNGTSSADASLYLAYNISGAQYSGMYLSGTPSGGSTSSYFMVVQLVSPPWIAYGNDYGGGGAISTIPDDTNVHIFIRVKRGTEITNNVFYPMISASGGAFAPYSNICPIEGRTGAELTQKDNATNPTVTRTYSTDFGETVHGGKWHVTEGGTDKTHANIANYNGETINEPWLSSMDEYSPGATPTTGAQVVYPLTTPTTISTPKQNVPMFKGINTVSADCGDTSLKYQPDNVIGELKGEIEDNIIYEDFKWTTESSQSYSAGTPGTYGTSNSRIVTKEGYDVIGVTFVENRRLGDCILTLHYTPSSGRVEVIIFRATSSSITVNAEDITYRVAYKKRT